MDKTKQDLRKIERAMIKLRNKVKRVDLDYNVQISTNSTAPGTIVYSAQMTALAIGLRPPTFIGKSADELVTIIKGFTAEVNYDVMEKAFHEAQIEACKRTIEGHKEAIEQIEKPKKEERSDEGSEPEQPSL